MFASTSLRELIEFTSSDPVLSVYLNTEPSEGNADAYRLRLRSMLKEVRLPGDVEAVERYIQHQYDWSGRSVALFSCAPAKFFRAFPLAVPVRDVVHIGPRPSVKILADLTDNYGGYGVVLIDKQGARLFYSHMGELREQDGVVGEAVKHTKRGGASAFAGRRGGVAGQTGYEEELVERNMRDAVDFAVHFFEENHVRRVLIGGTEDNVAMFRSLLPKAWQSLVKGTFPMQMTASHNEVLMRALQIGQEAEYQREAGLVEGLITAEAKGGSAVVGLEKVLAAAYEGRVQNLIVADGFRQPGYHCPECHRLSLEPSADCTGCQEAPLPVEDLIELLVSHVLQQSGEVEVVHASSPLENRGSIGAMLRY